MKNLEKSWNKWGKGFLFFCFLYSHEHDVILHHEMFLNAPFNESLPRQPIRCRPVINKVESSHWWNNLSIKVKGQSSWTSNPFAQSAIQQFYCLFVCCSKCLCHCTEPTCGCCGARPVSTLLPVSRWVNILYVLGQTSELRTFRQLVQSLWTWTWRHPRTEVFFNRLPLEDWGSRPGRAGHFLSREEQQVAWSCGWRTSSAVDVTLSPTNPESNKIVSGKRSAGTKCLQIQRQDTSCHCLCFLSRVPAATNTPSVRCRPPGSFTSAVLKSSLIK